MPSKVSLSRRNFLQAASSVSATALLRLGAPALAAISQAACSAKQQASEFLILGSAEAADFAAIAARIIPTTDTPGASEAGVIYFFDTAFADAMRDELAGARDGLAEFNAALRATGHSGRFDELSADEQDKFLREREAGEFFQLVRDMSIYGFFAMSSYGGNKDHIGWKLIGFEGHHGAWTYPFGHYDAEYAKAHVDGE